MKNKPGDDSGQVHENPEGRYANYFQIGQNAFEFIIDFGQSYEEHVTPVIHTRVVMSPTYAGLLLRTLNESVAKHRHTFVAADPGDDEGGNGSPK
jgi:hypothetical protein